MWSWSLIIYHSFLLLIILEKLKGNVFTSILPYKILSIVPPIYSQELAIWMQNHWYHICPSLPYILSNKARCSQTIFIFIMVFNLEIISIQKTLYWLHVHTWEKENVHSSCYPQNRSLLQTTFSLRAMACGYWSGLNENVPHWLTYQSPLGDPVLGSFRVWTHCRPCVIGSGLWELQGSCHFGFAVCCVLTSSVSFHLPCHHTCLPTRSLWNHEPK